MPSWNRGKGAARQWLIDHAGHQSDDCLQWPFSRSRGYGHFGHLGKNHSAHRFMCELVHGPAPSPKHHASHDCGRGDQGCVNPRHIFWKTPAQNMRDKEVHGTTRPMGFPRYKLTPEQVADIRATEGITITTMAAHYNVSESCIRKVRSGENWKTGRYSYGGFSRVPRAPVIGGD